MQRRFHPRVLLVPFALITVLQHGWYWGQLPERVATHFGVDGQPNDWMSRTGATILLAAIQLGVPLLMVGVTALAAQLPASMVNIPHREYWLAPERREDTLSRLNRMMAWFGLMTGICVALISHVTFQANMLKQPLSMPIFGSVIGGFLLATLGLIVVSFRRFRLPVGQTPAV